MYPDSFDYYRAGTVEEALALLDKHAEQNPTVLAGGHSLVPTMKSGLAAPDAVVDIGDIDEMSGIDVSDGALRVGASTRYEAVVDDADVLEHAPVLAEATSEIGDTQVRNRGTVGGNIAHADPASDLPAVMIATDATIHAQSPAGSRTIPADDFFLGIYATALGHDELLVEIEVPAIGDGAGAYVKKDSPSSGYAVIGVAARLRSDDGAVAEAGIAANGALDHAVRLPAVESALEGSAVDDVDPDAAASHATDELDVDLLMDDLQADSAYRAQLLESYTARAIETAVDRLS